MFWIGMAVGFFIGAVLGVIVMALCVAAGKSGHDEF